MKLLAQDCLPLDPQPTAKEADWLRRLATSVAATNHVVPIGGHRDEDEPIVFCDWDGTWWAGRYVGSLAFDGHTLTIRPRFGLATLRDWLAEATSVVLTSTPGQLREDDSLIAQLLAWVWAHGLVEAARHGLPALRHEVVLRGSTIQGRIDIAASVRLIAAGAGQVVSVRDERSLDHAASAAIVAAYQTLRRWLGVRDAQWLPTRAKDLLPHLIAVTGAHPRVPTKAELDRIRYTPITAGFARIAELSRQIANRRGLTADVDAGGQTKGVLLDVAELWELYVLSILRKAVAPWSVTHGTREQVATRTLLHSDVDGGGLGTLIPDAILHRGGGIQGIADAKYKRLHPSVTTPNGPQREDLYQIAAYLGRYAPSDGGTAWGLLLYPEDPARPEVPPAEQRSPWSLDDGRKVIFARLPHVASAAVAKLRKTLVHIGVADPD